MSTFDGTHRSAATDPRNRTPADCRQANAEMNRAIARLVQDSVQGAIRRALGIPEVWSDHGDPQ